MTVIGTPSVRTGPFDDVYLSPLHARFELRDGELWVRDLGSRNGTWCYLEGPTRPVTAT